MSSDGSQIMSKEYEEILKKKNKKYIYLSIFVNESNFISKELFFFFWVSS